MKTSGSSGRTSCRTVARPIARHRVSARLRPERLAVERAGHLERPLLAGAVGRHQVQLEPGAGHLHIGPYVGEPALGEQDRAEVLGQETVPDPRGQPVGPSSDTRRAGTTRRRATGRAPFLLPDPLLRAGDVLGVGVVADVVAAGPNRRHRGGPRAHERVQHHVALVGEKVDQAAGQLDRERRRVSTRVALSGAISQRSVVASRNSSREIVAVDGNPRSSRFSGRDRPVEAALARDHDALGDVAQHRVAGALEATPTRKTRRRARPFHHTTSPRSRRPSVWRMSVTSPASER